MTPPRNSAAGPATPGREQRGRADKKRTERILKAFHEEERFGKAYDARLTKRRWGYLTPYRWLLWLSVFVILITSAGALVRPLIMRSAIDGVISGYPNNNTAEWATKGTGVSSWLRLTWPTSYTINNVVLFDRPNLNDQITSGTLTFSDVTIVSFGALTNDASSGLTVTLAVPITTTGILISGNRSTGI